jgi:hypothetical protein
MIKVVLTNRCRFGARPLLNAPVSARSFSAHNVAPLLVNPSNVTKDAIFVDASWHMPNSPRKAREEFLKKRLPQARFLDLDEVAKEHELGLKHMIPDPEVFAKFCGRYHSHISIPALRLTHFVTTQNVRGSRGLPPLFCMLHRTAQTPKLTPVSGTTLMGYSLRLGLSSCSAHSATQIRACSMVVCLPGNRL